MKAFSLHLLDKGPECTVTLSKEDAIKYLTQMVHMRRMEKENELLYKQRVVRGFCHLYSGEEACAVGVHASMTKEDCLITAYRCHGYCYMSGVSIESIITELAGKEGGCSRGKGGSMHMYGPNFYGGNGIVGAHIPIGTGIALALKYRNKGGISFTCYGDGAANQGQCFESKNMACLWKLPILYVVENNKYGLGTGVDRASCCKTFHNRFTFLPGIQADGMDILAVREAIRFAREFVVKNGPLIVELITYRYYGHSMSDPGTSYRSREEIEEVRKNRDPINLFAKTCVTAGLLTDKEVKDIRKKIKTEIEAIGVKAGKGKEPPVEELVGDIYSNIIDNQIRTPRGFATSKNYGNAINKN